MRKLFLIVLVLLYTGIAQANSAKGDSEMEEIKRKLEAYKANPSQENEVIICYLDTETTGFGSANAVIQLAMLKVRADGRTELFDKFYRPGQYDEAEQAFRDIEIHPRAQEVHNITIDMLENKQYIEEDVENIMQFLEDVDYILIHNASFDIGMLGNHKISIETGKRRAIDTAGFMKRNYREFESHKLEYLNDSIDAKHRTYSSAEAHRANTDVQMLKDVIEYYALGKSH